MISAGSGVIENDGVFKVDVTGIADVSEGVALNTYSANVEFDVEDTADAIAANATNLGKADDVVVVSGGADVTVSQAESIQNLSGYDAGRSEFNIEDNSAAVISATDGVLTDGNIHVDVTNTVGASDGAILNSFSADIDFTVSDDAADIAAEVMAVDTIDFSPLAGISEVDADVQSAISKMYAAGAAGTYNPETGSNQDAFDKGIITATELSKINGLYNSISEAEGEMVQQFITNLPFMGDLDDAEAVIVESGAAVDAAQAAAIQGISGYVGTMSDIRHLRHGSGINFCW